MKNKKKLSRDRANKGEKVFQMKGTFQEVWKEYIKLNDQLKNKNSQTCLLYTSDAADE